MNYMFMGIILCLIIVVLFQASIFNGERTQFILQGFEVREFIEHLEDHNHNNTELLEVIKHFKGKYKEYGGPIK